MTLARTPYARLSPADIGQVDRELKKLEQMSAGLYVPKVLVHARSPYTVQGTDTMLLCDCTAGPITLTFPLAARVDGMSVQVVKSDTSANPVTLSGTFSGVVNPTISVPDSGFTVVAMNGSYHVTAFVPSPIVPGETGVASIVYDYGDPRRYGATGVAGTDARAAFAATDVAAIAGYGANGEVSPHGGTHRLASNITITSPFDPLPKAIVKPDSGVTLTFNGPVSAGAYRWLDLSAGGKVNLARGAARRIYPEWFGADPSGTNDSTVALQAALDTAIASNKLLGAVVSIVLSGRYKTTDSLHGFFWAAGAFSFCTFHIECAPGYIGTKLVEIVPTFVDRPVLILQAARAVTIKGVGFTGALPLVGPTNQQALLDTGGSAGTPWWNSGSTGRDSRYSPYCAIALDPFSNGLPPDGGIPGHSAFYTQNVGSSVVTVENCLARGFIVAFAVGLSNGSLQCDNVTFEKCTIENCKVAYACGHTQNRATDIYNTHGLFVRTMFDCSNYGVGAGVFPNVVGGLVAGGCKWLFIANPGFSPGSIKQFYAESIWSLGFWGWNGGGFPLTMDDCDIQLIPPGAGGFAPASHLHTTGPVTIRGGFLGFYNNVYQRPSFFLGASLVLDTVQKTGEPVVLRNALIEYRAVSLRYSGQGFTYGIRHVFRELFTSFASNADPIMGPMCQVEEATGAEAYRIWKWRAYDQDITADGAAAITVNGDGTATFTSATAAARLQVGENLSTQTGTWNAEKYDATLPNIAYTGLSIGRVQSIVGNVVTLQDVPTTMVTATHNTVLGRLPHFRPRTVGTATSGSNVIAAVSNTLMWIVGDRIDGTFVPTGSYVTAVNAGASTITISQNLTANGTVELYDVKMELMDATATVIPSTSTYFRGDFVRNTAGTKDANNMIPTGWRCTVSGRADGVAPAATFETIYGSTVTPAT